MILECKPKIKVVVRGPLFYNAKITMHTKTISTYCPYNLCRAEKCWQVTSFTYVYEVFRSYSFGWIYLFLFFPAPSISFVYSMTNSPIIDSPDNLKTQIILNKLYTSSSTWYTLIALLLSNCLVHNTTAQFLFKFPLLFPQIWLNLLHFSDYLLLSLNCFVKENDVPRKKMVTNTKLTALS